MKKTITFIIAMFTIAICTKLNAQCTDCDVKGINTDAREDAVNAENCEDDDKRNRFNWQIPNFDVFYSSDNGNTTSQFPSPFWSLGSEPLIGTHAGFGGSDFFPEDGWELIKFDNGYLADNATQRTNPKTFFYLCLYNKHSGVMRFFGMMPSAFGPQVIRFKIEIPQWKRSLSTGQFDYDPQPLSATNFLSLSGEAAQPLDQETDNTFLEIVTVFPGADPSQHWFWFDVPVAYDPCVCKNDVAIGMTAQLEQTTDIVLRGWLNGEIIQKIETDPNNPGYNKLVRDRLIGAGVATIAAIASGGKSVILQTSAFTGLLDIYTQKPGLDPRKKAKMEGLKTLLQAAGDLVYNEKEGKWRNTVTNESLSKKEWMEVLGGINKFLSGTYDFLDPQYSHGQKMSTSVLGEIHASGTGITTLQTNNPIYWGLPGSKMSKTLDEEVSPMPPNQSTLYYDPEYPLFNEVLGTFALLKTPKVNVVESDIELCTGETLEIIEPGGPPQLIPSHRIHNKVEFNLSESLLYHFNPLTNVNLNKTKISVAYVYTGFIRETLRKSPQDTTLTRCFEPWELEMAKIKPINLNWNIINTELISPIVPINQFKNLVVRFINRSDVSHLADSLFIRFFIEYESNDLDYWNEEPIKNIQVFTFPVEVENVPQLQAPLIDVVREDSGHFFDTPTFFTSADNEFFNGLVTISSHLSYSGPGIKTIYSLVGFDIKPGALINSNIALRIGYPLPYHEQPMQTKKFVNSFCESQIPNLQYKANTFSAAAIQRNLEELDRLKEMEEKQKEDSKRINQSSIHPNPTNGYFMVAFERILDADAHLNISDLSGRTVQTEKLSKGSSGFQILGKNLSSGIYFVTITQNGNRTTHKVVVNQE